MKTIAQLKILLVDDDPDLLESVGERIALEGAEVDMASSGRAALEKIKSKVYDCIISDMRMPNGDGRFLAKELAQMATAPTLFIYSGFNDLEESELHELRIKKVFSKPFVFEELMATILKAL